jgi:hypothetical protein
MKLLKFFIPFLLIAFASCSDDDKVGNLDVNFQATYDGEELLMQTDYQYPSGGIVKFTRLSYYVDDFKLDMADKNLSGGIIKYFDFSDRSLSTDPIVTKGYTFENLEEGLYNDLSFDIGVNAADNAKTPADFDPSNPLSNSAEYWGGWKSYVFAKIEGVYTLANEEPILFSLHLGADEALMKYNIPLIMNVKEGNNKVNVTLDVKKVFGTDVIYDLKANPSLHSLTHKPYVLELARNFEKAISVTSN